MLAPLAAVFLIRNIGQSTWSISPVLTALAIVAIAAIGALIVTARQSTRLFQEPPDKARELAFLKSKSRMLPAQDWVGRGYRSLVGSRRVNRHREEKVSRGVSHRQGDDDQLDRRPFA